MSRFLMIQGTASGVGKSLITAGLLRYFLRRGRRVVPFKAENMSLNSGVTVYGEEIARAQILQALAARREADSRMNPILLKPQGGTIQVIVRGKIWKKIPPFAELKEREFLWQVILESILSLSAENDLILIEGMGSPAEINLRKRDMANMRLALHLKTPVVLVGDIERGGVFASLYGTWALLKERERELLRGFVINKLHGDKGVLRSGIEQLERLTGMRALGVLPYVSFLLDEEDSLHRRPILLSFPEKAIHIGIVALPHLANYTDFQPLLLEEDVSVSLVSPLDSLENLDLVILPGTKNTLEDTIFLVERGFAEKVGHFLRKGGKILGVCGGFQMLGRLIRDEEGIESPQREVEGLSIVDMITEIHPEKVLRRVRGYWESDPECLVEGYEIHNGRSRLTRSYRPFFIVEGEGEGIAIGEQVFGTYLHGLFDSARFRRHFLNLLRTAKGLPPLFRYGPSWQEKLDEELDRLSEFCAQHLDVSYLEELIDSQQTS